MNASAPHYHRITAFEHPCFAMGGTTSKLKENVWEKADGKLRSPEDTMDGRPPTSEYAKYTLTKRGVNQREFDVTDSESNLIYTTRQVPGTIACFDVSCLRI